MPVSVGIPFYNAEKYLADAIRSVFAQTYQDWELILVDDGSEDRSLEIANSVNDSRVRVISDGKNRKLPYRLNQLIDESRYEIIARMDADDMMAPSRLETQLKCFENPAIDLAGTHACVIDAESNPLGLRGTMRDKFVAVDFFRARTLIHPSVMARKTWCQKNRYNTAAIRMEDTELWCRAYALGRLTEANMCVIPEPLLFYRSEGGSLSLANLKLIKNNSLKMIRKYGPVALGNRGTRKELFRYHIKHSVRNFAVQSGASSFLLSQRNRPLQSDKKLQISSDVKLIVDTKVPGLD